jgi:hypothetical protein
MNPLPNHGTKILGVALAALGGFLIPYQDAIMAALGHASPGIAIIVSGLFVFLRGFQNSANQAAQDAAPTPANSADPSVATLKPKSTTGSNTAKLVLAFACLSSLLSVTAIIQGCQALTPTQTDIVLVATDVAVGVAESKGVSAAQINAIAKTALAADQGASATVSVVTAVLNAQVAKLNLSAPDQAAATILIAALDTAISQQLAANPKAATVQANIATILQNVISITGG